MDKLLGQDLNKLERIQFLKDNCNKIEDLGYVKQIPQEDIDEIKDMLVEKSIQLRDIRADKKEANRQWNEQIKQLHRESEIDAVIGRITEACPGIVIIEC
ncbi:MAG: hypothetical protein ACI30I_04235 [Parabacteroides sp.]